MNHNILYMFKGNDFERNDVTTENTRSPSEDEVRGTTGKC